MTVMMMIVRMVSVPESPPHLAKKGKSNALSASAFYHGRYFHSPQTYNIQNSYPTFLIYIRPVFILLYLPTATTLSSVYLLCASKYANKVKSTYTLLIEPNQNLYSPPPGVVPWRCFNFMTVMSNIGGRVTNRSVTFMIFDCTTFISAIHISIIRGRVTHRLFTFMMFQLLQTNTKSSFLIFC